MSVEEENRRRVFILRLNLRIYRLIRSCSLEEAAAAVDMSPSLLEKVEKPEQYPLPPEFTIQQLYALCGYYDIPVGYLDYDWKDINRIFPPSKD